MKHVALGVNVDHVATVREARGGKEPDPVWAATLAQLGGADGITVHLREDRRHIQDHDVRRLKDVVQVKLNLEMSVAPDIVRAALSVRPDQATLVPERRQELTTEGGLDVVRGAVRIGRAVGALKKRNIAASLFVEPLKKQVEHAARMGAAAVELNTGRYANAPYGSRRAQEELKTLKEAADLAAGLGLKVYAGHGLNYINVREVAAIPEIEELNIGHSIVSRALFVGLSQAVREMVQMIQTADRVLMRDE
ncbi:MAG: pyridoxine 5'-phosphate synthase [Candidatus Omnitrophica bacterium]|nr:pyridoxine 5'-phosphate synthase [Candidatus Omnitrophota bacterium]